MKVDYLILGQGIAGSFMSYYLMKAGKRVMVIDQMKANSASRVASGVINPVTGRRIVQTWRIDELLPFASHAYEEIAGFLQMAKVSEPCKVLDIHTTLQMQQAFQRRLDDADNNFIAPCANEAYWQSFFSCDYGIGEIQPAYIIYVTKLLNRLREYLTGIDALMEEPFNWKDMLISENTVQYKDITADKIICCEGAGALQNPYFRQLPFALNKGEAMIVSIPRLPGNLIYKQGFSIVPWDEKDLFWIGSTYEWHFADESPSAGFRERVETYLSEKLKVPYEIIDHVAAIRPANTERRPFAGLHPYRPEVGILNGMGTKGCSLAPFFAQQFTAHLLNGTPIDEEADVMRFFRHK